MNFKSLLIKDTSKKKKFWKVAESFEDLIQTRFKKQCKISLKGPLNKYSNNAQKLESYIFFLVGPYFGYHKTNSKAVKYFDLTTSILKPISTESSSSSYGFSLIRHSIKSKDFFCNNQPEVEKWYKLLKKFCIQIEFAVNYELQDQIGKGNFATVHKAKSKKDGNLYAVKIIESQGLAKSVKLRHAVRTEVSIHRGLHHPHILRFFEVYEDEEKIYMVFQLLEGGELFDRVLKRKKYTEREAAIVMRQLLEALVYLESKRIIHRDLKLENILLVNKEDDCLIKLADFGLSVTLENLDPKVRCGTPGYVAPEIITGKAYDCKTDMFSAGAILYVLLSGCTPFPGKTFDEIMAKNRKCNPKFNTSYWANISFEAIDFVIKLMQVDYTKRPSPKEALELPWIKKMFEATPLSSRYNLDKSALVIDQEEVGEAIEIKVKTVIREFKTLEALISSQIPEKKETLSTSKKELFTKKLSLNYKKHEKIGKSFTKQYSLSPEAREITPSMRKQVVFRNFLKKMKTAGPTSVEDATELNETTMRQSIQSKFDIKSGLLNSFYAKGASQGTASETDEPSQPSPKRNLLKDSGLDHFEKSHRRSGFGRYSSIKNPSVGGLDKSFTDDNVPGEENMIKEMMKSLRSRYFTSKPGFQLYDTGDSDLGRSTIAPFPKFRNIFVKNAV